MNAPFNPLVRIGFGRWNISGLDTQFRDGSFEVKRAVIDKLFELFTKKDCVAEAVVCGCIRNLCLFVSSQGTTADECLLESTLRVLQLSLKLKQSQDVILSSGMLTTLRECLHKSCVRELRKRSQSLTLVLLSDRRVLIEALHVGYLDHYWDLVTWEKDIDCLSICMQVAALLVRESGTSIIPLSSNMISSLIDPVEFEPTPSFLTAALELLAAVGTADDNGKLQVIPAMIPSLTLLDLSRPNHLRTATWKFLSVVTILKQARISFVQNGGLQLLHNLFNEPNITPEERRFALLVLAAVCEWPHARSQLQAIASYLNGHATDKFERKALEKLLWNP